MVLYGYGNILLRTYVEIATTNNLSLLVISGKPTDENLAEAWEGIIAENGKHTNDHSYDLYQNLTTDYALLIAQHTVVSVCLEMLSHKIDFDVLEEVRSRGYIIDTTPIAFERTLKAAKSRCKNLITKAESKRLEIERQFKDKSEARPVSYDEIIGYLELALDRTVMDGDTITLAKYNVLKKGAEIKHKAKYGANSNRRPGT